MTLRHFRVCFKTRLSTIPFRKFGRVMLSCAISSVCSKSLSRVLHFPLRWNFVSPSFHHRCPFWAQLREAKSHDPETKPTDPAQPCSPAKPRRHPAQPNSSSAGPDCHSGRSSSTPARPDTSSDMPNSDWPACTSSLPACTSWNPAEPSHPALWSPSSALPPWRQVR